MTLDKKAYSLLQLNNATGTVILKSKESRQISSFQNVFLILKTSQLLN
jgi:hypothetical protein